MLFLNDLFIFLLLFIILLVVYRRIFQNIDLFEPFREKYNVFNRKKRINNYILSVTKKPLDSQKVIFTEVSILGTVLLIMFLLATKTLFFSAVVTGSMRPTFDRDDLVLFQNIEHSYKPGDIIMFSDPDTNRPYSHRIVNIVNGLIWTAGDASGMSDPWELEKKDILGKAIEIQGKPIVIKDYGKFFIIDDKTEDFGSFIGTDFNKYILFIQVVKMYGYAIAALSLLLYIMFTIKQKPWQSR